MKESRSWHKVQERGSTWGIRVFAVTLRLFGLSLARLLLHPIVAYFFLTDAKGRAASSCYLRRLYRMPGGAAALGRRPGLREQYRHMYSFGVTALDQYTAWSGSFDEFEIEIEGFEEVRAYLDAGQGVLLLGAHLGNFGMMRVLGEQRGRPIHVMMYRGHAQHFNKVLKAWAPESNLRVHEYDPGSPASILEIKQCIDRGELVGLLADRTPPGVAGKRRVLRTSFLGHDAPFPQGPWIIGSLLECPVFFVCGLRTGRNSYRVMARRLADRIELPREKREEHTRVYMARYTAFLEELCLEQPFQWFNFYDFWQED